MKGTVDVPSQVQRPSVGRIPSCLEDVRLFFLRPSTDWMRPIPTIVGNLFYAVSTNLNVSHPKSTFTEISRIMSDEIAERCGSEKVTHKLNHPRVLPYFLSSLSRWQWLLCRCWAETGVGRCTFPLSGSPLQAAPNDPKGAFTPGINDTCSKEEVLVCLSLGHPQVQESFQRVII